MRPITAAPGNPDGNRKTEAFPALGGASQVGWWQDFAYETALRFEKRCQREQTNVATIKLSANNSTGDTNGVGTLVLTFITT